MIIGRVYYALGSGMPLQNHAVWDLCRRLLWKTISPKVAATIIVTCTSPLYTIFLIKFRSRSCAKWAMQITL